MTSGERSRYGLVVSAFGAVALAVAVFLPWYSLSFTAGGASYVEQVGRQLVSQFGNASLQAHLGGLHGVLSGAVGQPLVAVSAHQSLHVLSVVLPVLAGLALLDTMLALARPASAPGGAGASVAVLGGLASALVAYRMLVPPTPTGGLLSLSLREGAWFALLGSLMIVLGALWPRVTAAARDPEAQMHSAFSGLSGWTPGA